VKLRSLVWHNKGLIFSESTITAVLKAADCV
jgi:hypothetical protein